MSDVGRMQGTPWHVEQMHRSEGDSRRHRARCIYYDKNQKLCVLWKNKKCYGTAHCSRYKEKQSASEKQYKESQEKKKHEEELKTQKFQQKLDAMKQVTNAKDKKHKESTNESIITKCIDDNYFYDFVNAERNIFLIALEKKLDIYNIICECEQLCKDDSNMDSDESQFTYLTPLVRAQVFMNILADKMDCDAKDFVFMNKDECDKRYKALINKMLDELLVPHLLGSLIGKEDVIVAERYYLNKYINKYVNLRDFNIDFYIERYNYYFGDDDLLDDAYSFGARIRMKKYHSDGKRKFDYIKRETVLYSHDDNYLSEVFKKCESFYKENGGEKVDVLDFNK